MVSAFLVVSTHDYLLGFLACILARYFEELGS